MDGLKEDCVMTLKRDSQHSHRGTLPLLLVRARSLYHHCLTYLREIIKELCHVVYLCRRSNVTFTV